MTNLPGSVAVRALGRSVLINMVAPGLLYAVASRHLPAGSLWPLAISGLPPLAWLAYGILKLRAIDWLGLFAAENVAVRLISLVLAHTEREALIGRSLENAFLALLFAGSLLAARPLMFYLMRQLATGNDPSQRAGFDRAADTSSALRPYRTLTIGWTVALLVKAAGSLLLATSVPTRAFLVLSPLWDLVADALLVGGSILYGRRRGPGASRSSNPNPETAS